MKNDLYIKLPKPPLPLVEYVQQRAPNHQHQPEAKEEENDIIDESDQETMQQLSDEDAACIILDNDDIQCGHIFFSETTRVLKYFCIYCKSIYDNINFYCAHLSMHINENTETEVGEIEIDEEGELNQHEYESHMQLEDDMVLEPVEHVVATKDFNVNNTYYYSDCDNVETTPTIQPVAVALTMANYNVNRMLAAPSTQLQLDKNIGILDANSIIATDIVKDIITNIDADTTSNSNSMQHHSQIVSMSHDDAFWTKEEDEKDSTPQQYNAMHTTEITPITEQLDEENCINDVEEANHNANISTSTAGSGSETTATTVAAAMDFENMIVATNIRGNLNDASKPEKKKKGKKVTTVKVIAVRNRIAELYEKIKTEEEKRSQMTTFDAMLQTRPVENPKIQDFADIDDATTNNDNIDTSTTTMQQKIRGETLITLLPKDNIPHATSSGNNSVQTAATTGTTITTTTNNNDNYTSTSKDNNGGGGVSRSSREKVCPACGMQFRSSFSLTIHKRTHYLESNSEVKLAHKCSDCNRLFNKISEMKVHVERDHYPDGFICRICQKRLTSLTLLEKHMRLVHLNRPFSCKICQKSFETRTLFEAHIDSHIEGRNCKCRICGRKYGTEQSLKHHMRRHKEQVPKCCVVCGKMTLRITQHMKIHTPRPKRVLSCNICGKLFNFSSGLSHHFKIMHKLPRPQAKIKEDVTTNVQKQQYTSGNSTVVNATNRRRRTTRRGNKLKIEEQHKIIIESVQPLEQVEMQMLQQDQEHQHNPQQQQLQQHENQVEQILLEHNVQHNDMQEHDHYTYVDDAHQLQQLQHQHQHHPQDEQQLQHQLQQDVSEKEEEAKRVIVELIQNATYTSFLPDNHMNEFEVGPPIAREETISAVNSIVNDC